MERLLEFVGNHPLYFSLLISILILLIWNFFGDTLSGVKSLSPEEVTGLINRENAKVLDLRTQKEFEKGHIIDAINISIDQASEHFDELKKYKKNGVIFCCASGSVSIKRARKLMNEGYEKVFSLKGGILSWQNANLPLIKGLK